MLTPVDNPTAYGLVETDAESNIRRFLEKPKVEEITCNTINAGIYVLEPETFDRIPPDVAWSIERSFFPSFIERGETFLASIYRDYWIDIGTPEKYMQVHRDIMDGRYSMPPFNGEPGMAWVSPSARVDASASWRGRCSSTKAAWSRRAPDWALTPCLGKTGGRRRRQHRRRYSLGRLAHRPRSRPSRIRSSADRARSAATPTERGACWETARPSPTTAAYEPTIFKAYDVRGLYPAELDEQIFHQIGRAFVTYLAAKRIGVGRDMRVSSPALTAAFIAGAREQGADVVDYGMIATDMIYYAVATDDLDGGAQITASHNPKQYNGCKMVGRGNHPLSGDAGISDIRDMIAERRIPAPAAKPGGLTQRTILDGYVEARAQLHRSVDHQAVQSGARCRLRHGCAASRPSSSKRSRARWTRCVSQSTAPSPLTKRIR